MKAIANYFRSGEAKPLISENPEVIKKSYQIKRWSVFLSLIIGYGLYYVCRLSISVVKKPIIDSGVFDATQLGAIGAGLLFVYAIGKMANGFVADRCNIKKFLSVGLMASAIINLLLGFSPGFIIFFILWAMNGWFQSMGSAPCVVSLSQWFSPNERGTRYGIWSVSHYIGEALTFIGTAIVVSKFGWQSAFTWAGVVSIIGAYLVYKFMYDRPEVYGLPNVLDYKNERAVKKEKAEDASIWEHQKEVLKNPYVWLIGLSAACMGIVRYAINSWGIIFLQESKELTLVAAGSVLAVTPIMGALGSAASGFISDKIFKSRHAVTTVVFCVLEIIFITLFCLSPEGNIAFATCMLAGFGFSLGVLLCFIGGLLAVDISSPKAAGAAMGTIGLLAYLGAMAQDIINGILMDAAKHVVDGVTKYNFDSIIIFWIGSSVVMLLLILPSLKAKRKQE